MSIIRVKLAKRDRESHMTPPSMPSRPDPAPLDKLVEIMATLRSTNGCPWDREQTHESLKPYLLEECYEVLEALDAQEPVSLKEELGDLLLQILFHAQIASEQGQFDFAEVCDTLARKLIHRHPHVFKVDSAKTRIQSASDVIQQWDRLKRQEQTTNGTTVSPEGDS
ncbi:MAG: MazG family protein [Nitrospirales bacterium]|nr:MazG family protein [Nitrospirales bacterium]